MTFFSLLLVAAIIGVSFFGMSFALVLLLLSAITGCIVLLDRLVLAKRRKGAAMPGWIESSHAYFPIFLAVLLFRSFIIEPFRIPSSSLEPTLLVGDFVAVNKFAYGLRLPVWETKILPWNSPKVGDVAVFRWPPNPAFDYIKRVVGAPGDVVSYHNKQLTINGVPMTQTFIENTIDESSGQTVAKYSENLNGVTHAIYVRPSIPATDFEVTVPANAYFMMGDNRDDSADSRYWGVVDDQYLRGKAFITWMSWGGVHDLIRVNRIGRLIH
jgi:signal peptidase I